MHIADDPATGERLKAFLRKRAQRVAPTPEQLIRSEACQMDDSGLRSPASGPDGLWWYDDSLAFFAELQSWIYDGMDRWKLWAFATGAAEVPDARAVPAFAAIQPKDSPWCYLCGTEVSPGQTCTPDR